MGFFSSTQHLKDGQRSDSVPFEEEYIRRTTRLPSKAAEYQNEAFIKQFNQIEEVLEETVYKKPQVLKNPKKGRNIFRNIFRRNSKHSKSSANSDQSNKENITPPSTDEFHDALEDFSHRDISIDNDLELTNDNFEILEDHGNYSDDNENSSLQISIFQDPPKSKGTIKTFLSKAGKKHVDPDVSIQPVQTNKIKEILTLRLFINGNHKGVNSHLNGDSTIIIDAKETLTQRYSNYDNLESDMNLYPFDLSIPKEKFHQKVVQAFSPKRNYGVIKEDGANSSKFEPKAETSPELESWNPYNTFRAVRQIDALSLASYNIDSDKEQDQNNGKRKSGRFFKIARKLTLRRSKPNTESILSKPINNSMDSVNFLGEQSTLKSTNQTINRRQPLKEQYIPALEPEFFETEKDKSSNTSSKTVVGDMREKLQFSQPASFSPHHEANTETHSEFKFGSSVTDCPETAVNNEKYFKEHTQSGTINIYQEFAALPISFNINNENIYKSILSDPYLDKEEILKEDMQLKRLKSIKRTNSVKSASKFNPFNVQEAVQISIQKEILEEPEENISKNKSYYLNPNFVDSLSDLEVESGNEDDFILKDKEFEELKGLVRKNKARQREYYRSGGL